MALALTSDQDFLLQELAMFIGKQWASYYQGHAGANGSVLSLGKNYEDKSECNPGKIS